MITLESFGPAFGLPDPSPFVTKAEMLLKMRASQVRLLGFHQGKSAKRQRPMPMNFLKSSMLKI